MKKKTQKNTIITKIAVATMIAIFSLGSAFAGTVAWFSSMSSTTVTGGSVSVLVANSGAEIDSINLIKFNYDLDVFGSYDYAEPSHGRVVKYAYDQTSNTFGEYVDVYHCSQCNKDYLATELTKIYKCPTNNTDLTDKTWSSVYGEYVYTCGTCEQSFKESVLNTNSNYVHKCKRDDSHTLTKTGSQWVSVDLMNTFDPVEMLVKGNSFNLRDMYSNAIYELTFSANNTQYLLEMVANILNSNIPVEDEDTEVKFTTCVDFDIYTEEDLAKFVGTTNGVPNFYPTFITGSVANRTYKDLEEIYHRISYYAANSNAPHTNFYAPTWPDAVNNSKTVMYNSVLESLDTSQASIAFDPSYHDSQSHTIYVASGDHHTYQLHTVLNNPGQEQATVTYTSSNTNVATVSNSGLVTAVSKGVTVISASALGKTTKMLINVSDETDPNYNNANSYKYGFINKIPLNIVSTYKVYININYASSCLRDYVDKIDIEKTITTICDFNFGCKFE